MQEQITEEIEVQERKRKYPYYAKIVNDKFLEIATSETFVMRTDVDNQILVYISQNGTCSIEREVESDTDFKARNKYKKISEDDFMEKFEYAFDCVIDAIQEIQKNDPRYFEVLPEGPIYDIIKFLLTDKSGEKQINLYSSKDGIISIEHSTSKTFSEEDMSNKRKMKPTQDKNMLSQFEHMYKSILRRITESKTKKS